MDKRNIIDEDLITANQENPLPKEPDLIKLEKVFDLVDSLFTKDGNKVMEITDLEQEEIRAIATLSFFDRVLGWESFGALNQDFMRLKISKQRKSRSEVLDAIRSIFLESETIEGNSIENKSRIRNIIGGFMNK